jgi:hypothetical protein
MQVRDDSLSGYGQQRRRKILRHIAHHPAAPISQRARMTLAAAIAEAKPGAGAGLSFSSPLP